MHHHRRRKKRPSYGVRTVEITRGKNGFGFTISGQAPCILSCIITGSPAEKAGLRPGDFLVAVNGQNVSKALHDDVVRLIGNSSGILKLQIAENYYSDSSEEEFVSVVKLKPKYSHKVRHRLLQNSVSRAEKVVQDLQTGALFVDHIHGADKQVQCENKLLSNNVSNNNNSNNTFDLRQSNKALWDLILQKQYLANRREGANICLQNQGNPLITRSKDSLNLSKKVASKCRDPTDSSNASIGVASGVFHSIFTDQDLKNILYPAMFTELCQNKQVEENTERAILKVVVGYLGTIEMPKEPQVPNSRLQTIRNCIRRLRIERKVHSLVLMTVFPESIILINPQGLTLAEFAAEKLTFSGVYSDDKKFFGLVTNHETSSIKVSYEAHKESIFLSSSCHVFMVDPKLTPHHQHIKRAKAFHIACTPDPITSKCKEFPESAEAILQAVVGLYRSRIGLNIESAHEPEFNENMSPPPSNTSSNSSNSDSGIGFRDEGNTSDRVLTIDTEMCNQYGTNSLECQVLATPGFAIHDPSLPSFSLIEDKNILSVTPSQTCETSKLGSNSTNCQSFDRLTVRAMPDPVGFQNSTENLDIDSDLIDQEFSVEGCKQINKDYSLFLKSGHNLCYKSSSLESLGKTCPLGLGMQKKEFSSSKNVKVHKLSPKVYDFYFPLKNASSNSVSVDSVSWNSGVCCLEEISNFESHSLLHQGTSELEDRIQRVNLPTLEDDFVSENFELQNEWTRTSSLRRHVGHKRNISHTTHEAGFVSDGELAMEKVSTSSSLFAHEHLSDSSSYCSSFMSEKQADISHSLNLADFSVVLDDPVGLHLFREFLKKEFSEENITFWIACEHYRQLSDKEEMIKMAEEIYSRHLSIGAHEPVNVDSHARQVAQEGLATPTPDLFLPAQKQIFNLMKFDCYQRFLKSSIFKENLLSRMQSNSVVYEKNGHHNDEINGKVKKIIMEKKKRKPLIPWLSKGKSKEGKCNATKLWNRHCDIRKSLKKKKNESNLVKLGYASSTQSDVTSSRSSLTGSETGILCKNISSRESLNSEDLAVFPRRCGSNEYYCRVILPDCSTTVVRTQKNETVGQMLLKLLERRCLTYNAVEAYIVGSDQPLDHSIGVRKLSCKEVRVEQVILFCLELPNKKTIGVKAKNGKTCSEILKPVLHKYGYKIENVIMIIASSHKHVPLDAAIAVIDNQRINIILKEPLSTLPGHHAVQKDKEFDSSHAFPDFEALTNQIFEDLLKNQLEFTLDGLGVVNMDSHCDRKVNEFDLCTQTQMNAGSTNTKLEKSLSGKSKEKQRKSHRDGPSRSSSLSKVLLPHNARSSFSNDNWKRHQLTESKENLNSDLAFDSSMNDHCAGKENCPLSANKHDADADSTFIGNESIDLADVTLKAQSQSDDSLSPCQIPTNGNDNTLVYPEFSDSEISFSHLSMRKIPEPPPVPPKALSRGPPPRPPNRQLVSLNSRFGFTSKDDQSDVCIETEVATHTERGEGKTMNNVPISNDYKDFNISFV